MMKVRRRLSMAGVVVGAALAVGVGVPSSAWAAHCDPGQVYPVDCVHGETVTPPPAGGTEVRGSQEAPAEPRAALSGESTVAGSRGSSAAGSSATGSHEGSGRLPVTGGDIVGLAVMGLAAVGVGTFLVRRSPSLA